MRIGQSFQPSTSRTSVQGATPSSDKGGQIADTFQRRDKNDWLKLEAKALFVAGAAAAGAYAGWNEGILPGIVGAGVAGVALAKHGAELGNAAAGGELPGAIVGAGTGIAGLALGAALGSGILGHLVGIHVDHRIAAGVLGATGALLAFRACNSKG